MHSYTFCVKCVDKIEKARTVLKTKDCLLLIIVCKQRNVFGLNVSTWMGRTRALLLAVHVFRPDHNHSLHRTTTLSSARACSGGEQFLDVHTLYSTTTKRHSNEAIHWD